MRRIVVLAISNAGFSCAAAIKEGLPSAEVILLAPPLTSPPSGTTGMAGALCPALIESPKRLAALDLSPLFTQSVELDIEGRTIAASTDKGALPISYTDLVVEAGAIPRIPRSLQNISNIFTYIPESLTHDNAPLFACLKEAATNARSILVVGNGMVALKNILLALQFKATVVFAETRTSSSPQLDKQLTDYIFARLGKKITRIPLDEKPTESLEFSLTQNSQGHSSLPQNIQEKITAVSTKDGLSFTVEGCLWADTLMAMHPIIREEAFYIDEMGRLASTEDKPSEIHIIGSGAALDATLLLENIAIPAYIGSSEVALASAANAAQAVTRSNGSTAACYGTCAASMKGFCVFRSGLTSEEAQALHVETEHATVTCETGSSLLDANDAGRITLRLIAHKTAGAEGMGSPALAGQMSTLDSSRPTETSELSERLLGVQVIGEGAYAPLAEGVCNIALSFITSKTTISQILATELTGFSGSLLKACVTKMQQKLKGTIFGITPDEFLASYDGGADFFLLDVRDTAHWQQGHLPEAYNIPVLELKKRMNSEIPRMVPIMIVCDAGDISYRVAEHLAGFGAKDLYVLDGGMNLWPYPARLESEPL